MPRSEQFVIPPTDLILVSNTSATTDVDLPTGCRGLLIGTAGVLNITINGNDRDSVPMLQGVNPGFFERIRITSSGSAQNIWAIV